MFFQWGWSSHISEQTPQSNSHIYRCTAIAKIESCFWIDGLSMSNALGGIRIISIQRQCCSKMALKSRKKVQFSEEIAVHLFIYFICNIESRVGNPVLYRIIFNRIIVWKMNYKNLNEFALHWRPSSNNFIFGILVSDICLFHSLDRPFKHWNGMYITPNKAY